MLLKNSVHTPTRPCSVGVFAFPGGATDTPDVHALLTASEGARYAGVSVQTVVNWRNRGHLPQAGWKNGRPAYTLLDLAKAEHATRRRARR